MLYIFGYFSLSAHIAACAGRAHARQPRTTFSSLLPPSYFKDRTAIFAVLNGSPLQSDHALLSTFFSLLSTRPIPFATIIPFGWGVAAVV